MVVQLPQSKNQQDGSKSDVAIGPTGHPLLCALRTHAAYMQLRIEAKEESLSGDSFLFPVRRSGSPLLEGLTYQQLTAAMDKDLVAAGFDATQYNGHMYSWRIG